MATIEFSSLKVGNAKAPCFDVLEAWGSGIPVIRLTDSASFFSRSYLTLGRLFFLCRLGRSLLRSRLLPLLQLLLLLGVLLLQLLCLLLVLLF